MGGGDRLARKELCRSAEVTVTQLPLSGTQETGLDRKGCVTRIISLQFT